MIARLPAIGLVIATAGCQVERVPVAGPPPVQRASVVAAPEPGRHLMDCPLAEPPPPAHGPALGAGTAGPIEPVFQALPDANAGPVAVSPDGSLFAWVGPEGRTVSVSETRSGLCRATFPLLTLSWGDLLRWSPDGRRLAVSDQRDTLIFGLAEGGLAWTMTGGLQDAVWASPGALSLVLDAGRLARIDDHGAWLLEAGPPTPPARAIALHPGGRFLAMVGAGKSGEEVSLSIVDGETGVLCGVVGKVRADRVDALSWSPNGRFLAALGNDRSVAVYDAEAGGQRAGGGVPSSRHHRFWPLTWSEGGDVLGVASGGRLARWDAARGLTLPSTRIPAGREADTFALATEARGKEILAFGAGEAFTFDAGTGARTSTLDGARPVVRGLDQVILSSARGLRMAVAYEAGLALWDLAAGRLVSVLEQGSVAREEGFILFGSPDGKSVGFLASPHGVYTGPDWGRILLWDAETGRPLGRMHADAFSSPPVWIDGGARFVWEPQFHGPAIFDARTLRKLRSLPPVVEEETCDGLDPVPAPHGAVTICGATVVVWRGQVRHRIPAGPAAGGLFAPSPSPDGRLVAVTARLTRSGSDEPGELRVFEIASGKLLARVDHGGQAVWSPDGKAFLVDPPVPDRSGRLTLHEARTGKALRSFPGMPGAAAFTPAFSPDGASIAAVVGPGHGLVVWSVATGAVVAMADLTISSFDAPVVVWLGAGLCAVRLDASAELLLLRLSDRETVRVRFAAVGDRMGYLAFTRQGVFDLQGLSPEAVRFRDGRDLARAPLLPVEQVKRLSRPGLVGDLMAGRSVAP